MGIATRYRAGRSALFGELRPRLPKRAFGIQVAMRVGHASWLEGICNPSEGARAGVCVTLGEARERDAPSLLGVSAGYRW